MGITIVLWFINYLKCLFKFEGTCTYYRVGWGVSYGVGTKYE